MQLQKSIAALLLAGALGTSCLSANAAIVNISATSGVASTITLTAGTYNVDWIGTAQGGAYNGWQFNTARTGNWREAFIISGDFNGNVQALTIDKLASDGSYYVGFGSALDALAAFQTGPYAIVVDGGLVGSFTSTTLTISGTTTLSFTVPDTLLSDNTGGVSLRVQNVLEQRDVPEPGSLALVVGALAGVGAASRRRTAKR